MERDQLQLMVNLSDDISIHALRMERDLLIYVPSNYQSISIHALRMERDRYEVYYGGGGSGFQSTRSAWSATPDAYIFSDDGGISIHALRMERDSKR